MPHRESHFSNDFLGLNLVKPQHRLSIPRIRFFTIGRRITFGRDQKTAVWRHAEVKQRTVSSNNAGFATSCNVEEIYFTLRSFTNDQVTSSHKCSINGKAPDAYS